MIVFLDPASLRCRSFERLSLPLLPELEVFSLADFDVLTHRLHCFLLLLEPLFKQVRFSLNLLKLVGESSVPSVELNERLLKSVVLLDQLVLCRLDNLQRAEQTFVLPDGALMLQLLLP